MHPDRRGIEVVGLGLNGEDSVARYVADHAIRFPVVVLGDPTLRFLYRTQTVPQTLVIDARGRVVHVRHGEVEGDAAVDNLLRVARSRSDPMIVGH